MDGFSLALSSPSVPTQPDNASLKVAACGQKKLSVIRDGPQKSNAALVSRTRPLEWVETSTGEQERSRRKIDAGEEDASMDDIEEHPRVTGFDRTSFIYGRCRAVYLRPSINEDYLSPR